MIDFQLPWLFLLLPLPWVVYRFVPANTANSGLMVPYYHALTSSDEHQSGLGSPLRMISLSIIWGLVVLSATQPRWTGDPVALPTSGRDLMVAVDISGSMETLDMKWEGSQVDRLTAVKGVVSDFVERRTGDRLGLILFGSRAYLQAPLTFDRSTIRQLLLEAQLGFAGGQTAIGDAIGLSVKRLKDRPMESRVLILLTDGANTAGNISPEEAANLAKTADVRIYTVGIGAESMISQGLFGARRINPSRDLDEKLLTQIATQTGGQYFRARTTDELQAIYEQLDKLEPIEQESEFFRPVKALYFWPLTAALVLTLTFILQGLALQLTQRNKDVGISR